MHTNEWALVIFTILAQMSVGSFLVLGVVHFFATRKAGAAEADRLSDRALFAIGPVLVLGLLASFFHLGNPMNAYNAIGNLGSSWLSREILSGLGFAVVGGVFAVMQWRKFGTPGARNAVALLAGAIGLVLVFSMANVYQLRTVPAWNTVTTPLSFFVTTFLLGALAVGAALAANYSYLQRKQPSCAEAQCVLLRTSLSWIGLSAVALLGVEFVLLPLYLSYLSSTPATVPAGQLIAETYSTLLIVRLALAFLGAGLFGAVVYRNAVSVGREKIAGNWAYAAFALVLVSEVLGRFLFYVSNPGFSL